MNTPTAPGAASHEPNHGTESHGVSDHDVLRAAVMTAAWTTHEVLLAPEDITWARTRGPPTPHRQLPGRADSWSPPHTHPPAR